MGEWALTRDKLKKYPHFDAPLSVEEATALATDPARVLSHAFYPLLLFREEWWPFGRKAKAHEKKSRKIRYAARGDAYIYSYYRHLLSEHYERRLVELGITDNVIAYRKISATPHGGGKCNIHFADEAFTAVARLGNCCAVALDISKFFESIDHDRLKKIWCDLLGVERLPGDHWAVFKAITRYAEVDRDLAYQRLGFAHRRRNGSWEYHKSKREMPLQLCSPSDFRSKIAGTDGLIKPNENAYGIPQGAPLSDLLANAYLMDFDAQMTRYVRDRGGVYLRYSDDILIVLPGDGRAGRGARTYASKLIKQAGERLLIKPEKSLTVVFRRDDGGLAYRCIGRRRNGLEYLGFRFDGDHVYLRDSTLANLNRKIAKALRAEAVALVRRYRGKDETFLLSCFNIDRVMQKFGRVEDFDPSEGTNAWTFWSYARRATSILGVRGAPIFAQIKRQRAQMALMAKRAIHNTLSHNTTSSRDRSAQLMRTHGVTILDGYDIERV
ncbi:MAG: reverse transcriptase domain-containing protein [Hyphomicrobiaceae bacterium]